MKLYNCMNPSAGVEWDECEDVEDYMTVLASKSLTYEILTYICMLGVYKHWPECRCMGDSLSLRNPLHGVLYWYIAKNFLIFSVNTYKIKIVGLSDTDGSEDKLSSLATIDAIATAKIEALTAACLEQGIKVPDFSQFFFQGFSDECIGDEVDADTPAGSDADDAEDDHEDEDEEDEEDDRRQPEKKKKKVREM